MTAGTAGHLLDTHALIWWWLGDPALSKRAREVMAARTSPILVSAISGIEIALKVRAGKLPALAEPVRRFGANVLDEDFRHLDVRHDHAVRAGLLPESHRDPFDRIIAAQALIEGLTIITKDRTFAAFGCEAIW
jgi:PIN domain nuclease of toxin-antitoxin system